MSACIIRKKKQLLTKINFGIQYCNIMNIKCIIVNNVLSNNLTLGLSSKYCFLKLSTNMHLTGTHTEI